MAFRGTELGCLEADIVLRPLHGIEAGEDVRGDVVRLGEQVIEADHLDTVFLNESDAWIRLDCHDPYVQGAGLAVRGPTGPAIRMSIRSM